MLPKALNSLYDTMDDHNMIIPVKYAEFGFFAVAAGLIMKFYDDHPGQLSRLIRRGIRLFSKE